MINIIVAAAYSIAGWVLIGVALFTKDWIWGFIGMGLFFNSTLYWIDHAVNRIERMVKK